MSKNAARNGSIQIKPLVGSVAVYCLLGAVSISTAYVQTNAAAVWMPSGFAVGLLTVLGLRYWPAIAFGAFVVNLAINLISGPGLNLTASITVAACVTVGNTGEALLGAWLIRRLAAGSEFLWQPRYVTAFVLLAVTLAPLVSMAIGVSSSFAAGLPMQGSLSEVMLTWYIADAVGILIFASLTILLMTGNGQRPTKRNFAEAILLGCSIVVTGQAINGIYFGEWLMGWPKAYMVIPLLLWACFRFGVRGALFSIVLILAVSVMGTMRGFAAFPADTPSRSLIYLQIFLGMLTVMSLSIAAALSETDRLRASLEDTVRVRTRGLEELLREREIFTTLVAHDLQSPLYGVRNAIKVVSEAVAGKRITTDDVIASLAVMEQTCSTIADRVTTLLAHERDNATTEERGSGKRVADIVAGIASAHGLALRSSGVALDITGDCDTTVSNDAQVEHILDILIDNAIKHSPRGAAVSVATVRTGDSVEISVADIGAGVATDEEERLFMPRSQALPKTEQSGAGLGLYLAREQAIRLGGCLAYRAAHGGGAEFFLTLPVAA